MNFIFHCSTGHYGLQFCPKSLETAVENILLYTPIIYLSSKAGRIYAFWRWEDMHLLKYLLLEPNLSNVPGNVKKAWITTG